MNLYCFSWILFLLSLSACQNESEKESRQIFKYNQIGTITSLDPAFAKNQANIWPVNQIFNGLVQIDKALNIQPCIAKRWNISSDGLTYTFYLRDDVYFHDHEKFEGGKGRKVIAADFVYSLKRITDPSVASPGVWIFNIALQITNLRITNNIDTKPPFVALNDTTFQINLSRPFPPFLGILSMQYCSVVPKDIVEYYGKDFRSNPVGTGPFQFKLWEEGAAIILLKNEHYFEKEGDNQLPYLDGIRISFIENKQTEFLQFIDGKLDFMSDVGPSFKDDILTRDGNLQPKYQANIELIKNPYLNVEYLGILVDTTNPIVKDNPLKIKAIRQAINYGFDRKKMISYLRNNVGIAATNGFVPAGLAFYDQKKINGYDYNPQKARQLLKNAGFEAGTKMPEILLYTNSNYQDFCAFIIKQLEEIGLKIKMEVISPAFLREAMVKGKANIFRASWIADYPDAESFLVLFYGKNPAPPNYTRFNNPEFDQLYEAALREHNVEKRNELYQQMDQLVINEAPVVPLYYDQTLVFIHKYIEGLEVNSINLLVLKNVRIKQVTN